jgi:spore coat polysaccharide biosynthesis protein SpsF
MKTVAIIQARMTSTRLPGKVMAEVAGKPILGHVVHRAQQARTLDLVIVATSNQSTDNIVSQYSGKLGIPCFRGSEQDVLSRYYYAAKEFDANAIVRLTSDCPLLDPVVIDRVVQEFLVGEYDYVSNTLEPTYPDGLDTEVFRWGTLERAWKEATLKSEREHVTPYIWKNPRLFRLRNVRNGENLSQLRWTVDKREDLEFVRQVYNYLGSMTSFGMTELLALLSEHPDLKRINAGFERNEGYEKSLSEDSWAWSK